MSEVFYSLTEVAERLKISEKTVVRQIKNGKLKALKIGRLWRVSDEDFIDFKEVVTPKYKRKYA